MTQTTTTTINSLEEALSTPLQPLFDTVVERLLAQGKSSATSDGRSCLYFNKDEGIKCAVGLLLSQEELDTVLERGGNGADLFLLANTIFGYGSEDNRPQQKLLRALQYVHDKARHENSDPAEWRSHVIEHLNLLLEDFPTIHGNNIPAQEIQA